jgi:hypothetical protein
MKLQIIIFTLFISSITCFAQTDTSIVPFVSYWSIGDSYDFKVTKIKRQRTGGELTKDDSSSYIVNFQVIDSTASSYKIKWSYKTNFSMFNIPSDVTDRFSKYETTEVIYTTSEVGDFIAIENWEEISEMMTGVFSESIEYMSENGDLDEKEFTKIMQPIFDIYKSKEGIEQIALKEIQYFHFPMGLEYSTAEPVIYEDKLPNMFGGKYIRTDAKIYFNYIDFDANYCVLIQEMKLNEKDTKRVLESLFQKMGLDNKATKAAMKDAKFNITDYNRYAYFYYPCIPYEIETSRITTVDVAGKVIEGIDINRIELLD